jgi:Mce-associated membrane protein
VLAAALFAGAATWRYVQNDDGARHRAALRDQVAAAATQDVINLNTLDYRTAAADLDRWQNSATGTLYAEIASGRVQLAADAVKNKTVSSASILSVAVTEVDERAGKAAVLAAARVTVTRPDGTAGVTVSRLVGQLARTPAGWKMSTLSSAGGGE